MMLVNDFKFLHSELVVGLYFSRCGTSLTKLVGYLMAYEKFHCFNSFKHFTSLHTFDSHCDLLTHNVDFTSSLVDPHTGVYSIFIRRCSWNRKKLLEWLSYCSDSCLSFKSLYCRNGLACGCASI